MQQPFLCALATTLSATGALTLPSFACGGDDWARFDRDLEALVASSSSPSSLAPTLHGLLRARWAYLPDFVAAPGGPDHNGFGLDNAQVSLEGSESRFGYRVELEAASGTANLLDGYGTWDACEYVRVTLGRFRSPLLWESQLPDGGLLFMLRTDSAQLFYDARNEGAMLSGSLGPVHWAAAVQNGLDALEGEGAFTARVGWDVLGGGVGLHQGAYGAGSKPKLTVGGGYFDEPSQGNGKDGDIVAVDAQLRIGRFAADAMGAVYQDFIDPNLFIPQSDSQPWNCSVSFMAVEDTVEVAARYHETDNTLNEKDITAGVNYYLEGQAVKLQANATYVYSDNDTFERSIRIGIGACVGI